MREETSSSTHEALMLLACAIIAHRYLKLILQPALSIRLERENYNPDQSPALYASIHVFAARRNEHSPIDIEFYNHTIVTFRFNLVVGLRLTDFNNQNAIFDLVFEKPPDASAYAPLRIVFDPSFGIDCSFFCKAVDIIQVERRLPANSVYE